MSYFCYVKAKWKVTKHNGLKCFDPMIMMICLISVVLKHKWKVTRDNGFMCFDPMVMMICFD